MAEERLESIITKLPLEILSHIVSLVPLKEAIKTSLLSSSWKTLWSPFQVDLDFDPNQTSSFDEEETNMKLTQIMGLLLKPTNCPEVWKFFLRREKEGSKREKDLFFLAAMGAGNELHLDFNGRGKEMKGNFNLVLEPSMKKTANFSCLNSLNLISVSKIGKDLVSNLFSNCQILENLKLEKCNGLQNINIKATNSLKCFEVVDCENIESVSISAPNLKSFWYRGALPLVEINSSPNLVDVVLDLRKGFRGTEFDCEDVLNLLSSIKDMEILMISGWLIEWLCGAGVIFERLPFKFNKLKELCWFDSLMNQTKRDSLACFLNASPFLDKLFVKIDGNLSFISYPYFHQHWHEPHLWMDYETVKSNASQLQNLKIIQFEGFTKGEDQLVLMDLLLRMAFCTLKSMTVISPVNRSWWVSKIPKSQLKHTFKSNPKRTVISSLNEKYFFVLTEDDKGALVQKLATTCGF